MAMHVEVEEDRIRAAYARRRGDDRYSWFKPDYLFFVQEREREVLTALLRAGRSSFEAANVLEIGCGTGYWLREFIKWGARPQNVSGIDLLVDRIAEAKALCPQQVRILCGSATKLPLPDSSFDLVFQSTVFTSILDAGTRQRVAAEMVRVVKSDGLILWYDFCVNNPRNPDVRAVTKREILDLFPGCQLDMRRVTLAPPLSRVLARYSLPACRLLSYVPWLRTHYLCVIRKANAQL